jgi:hypothetical protein
MIAADEAPGVGCAKCGPDNPVAAISRTSLICVFVFVGNTPKDGGKIRYHIKD